MLTVHGLAATLTRATGAGAKIATPGGKPVVFPDGTLAILIRDIDNRLIELRELSSAASAQAGDIVDMRLLITVNDMDETIRAYRDILGFKVEGETAFTADASMRALTGLGAAEVRRSRVQSPGSTLWIELLEFKGVERIPLRMRIQDRGAARLQLRAQNVDSVVSAMKAAGMKVFSEGGVAVPIPPNFKGRARCRSQQLLPDTVRTLRWLCAHHCSAAALKANRGPELGSEVLAV